MKVCRYIPSLNNSVSLPLILLYFTIYIPYWGWPWKFDIKSSTSSILSILILYLWAIKFKSLNSAFRSSLYSLILNNFSTYYLLHPYSVCSFFNISSIIGSAYDLVPFVNTPSSNYISPFTNIIKNSNKYGL